MHVVCGVLSWNIEHDDENICDTDEHSYVSPQHSDHGESDVLGMRCTGPNTEAIPITTFDNFFREIGPFHD